MIVNVRGNHGSGKTTIVRAVMSGLRCTPVFIDERRYPIGYKCRDATGTEPIFVLGKYDDSPTGGCDTIPNVALMHKYIRKFAKRGYHVLFEGIVAQHATPGLKILHARGEPLAVVLIDIPIRRSIRAVMRRRRERGAKTMTNFKNIHDEAKRVESTTARLKEVGVRIYRCRTRARARARTFSLLGLTE